MADDNDERDPAPPDGSEDETRRRFRDALDRKRGSSAERAAGEDAGPAAKVHSAHGPAKSQRTFRRKSGG